MFTAYLPSPHLPQGEFKLHEKRGFFVSVAQVFLAPQTVPARRKYSLRTCWMNKCMKRWSKQDSKNTIRREYTYFALVKKWDLGQIRKKRIPDSWKFYGDFNSKQSLQILSKVFRNKTVTWFQRNVIMKYKTFQERWQNNSEFDLENTGVK